MNEGSGKKAEGRTQFEFEVKWWHILAEAFSELLLLFLFDNQHKIQFSSLNVAVDVGWDGQPGTKQIFRIKKALKGPFIVRSKFELYGLSSARFRPG